MARFPLVVVLLLLLGSRALAQAPAPRSVTLDQITVENEPPPTSIARLFDAPVNGVIDTFEACYAERLAVRPELRGEHRLRVYVSAQQVIRVTAESSSLGDPELEQCLKNQLLAFRLPPETPRGGVRVRFRLSFTPPPDGRVLTCTAGTTATPRCRLVTCGAEGEPCCGGARCETGVCDEAICRVPPPPPVEIRVTRASGGLDATEVGALVPPLALASCVNDAVGEVPVSLAIARNGRIRATLGRGTLTHTATRTCLRTAIQAIGAPPRPRTTAARLVVTVGAPR